MISDHRVVECTLTYNPMETQSIQKIEADPFRQYKVHNVDYLPMKLKLSDMDWDKLLEYCDQDDDGEQFKDGIIRVVLEVAEETLCKNAKPRTTKPKKISEPFKRKARKIKTKLQLDLDPLEKKILQNQLIDNDEAMKKEFWQKDDREEEEAVDTIKDNPRYFYTYVKKRSKTASSVAPLRRVDGSLTTESAEKAQLLQNQYTRVFSDPTKVKVNASLSWIKSEPEAILDDFDFTPEDIKAALKEIDPYGSAPDGDIPARILYECRAQLAYPLWLLWRRSMDSETIPRLSKINTLSRYLKRATRLTPQTIDRYH
eukprot:sb/3467016/